MTNCYILVRILINILTPVNVCLRAQFGMRTWSIALNWIKARYICICYLHIHSLIILFQMWMEINLMMKIEVEVAAVESHANTWVEEKKWLFMLQDYACFWHTSNSSTCTSNSNSNQIKIISSSFNFILCYSNLNICMEGRVQSLGLEFKSFYFILLGI